MHLVGIGGREFSVGRLSGGRIVFADSTLAALRLGLRMNLKMQLMESTEKKIAPPKQTTKFMAARRPRPRRRAAKHVPRVSPHSPASIDPGFVKIGLVQLSQ